MRYLPHTSQEITDMLKIIGASTVEDLFASIPPELRLQRPLKIPPALSELELRSEILKISKRNVSVRDAISFLGGGAYHHYIPSPISQLINRGEFFTAYTPYQPEVSQGTLQALFEYQTMLCELTGMEIANASNYDASTACAEALLMAHRLNGKKRALVAKTVHPQYRKVMKTYLERFGFVIDEIPYAVDGTIDDKALSTLVNGDIGALLIQSPNYFGVIEDLDRIGAEARKHGAIFITAASEPLSAALLKTSGESGADIAVMEGQSFGVGLNFGGPYLGIFASRQKYVRSLPGRLVGETVDVDGKSGYVLTFSTREQHIRREKATSNICTNQGLCALMASIYLALLGKQGLVELAKLNLSRATYAKKELLKTGKINILFDGPTFNEFVIFLPNAPTVLAKLREKGIFGGILIDRYYDELKDAVLVCVTEMNPKEDIDLFVKELTAILR